MNNIEPWYLELAAPLNTDLLALPIHERRVYGDLMAQAYYWVSHSTRLLALAASRLGTEHEAQHRRLLEHAREENGHHLYAERDLDRLGLRVDDFSELAPTAALYQTQYYLIEHVHPIALFGYIIMLEGMSVLSFGRPAVFTLLRGGPAAFEPIEGARPVNLHLFGKMYRDFFARGDVVPMRVPMGSSRAGPAPHGAIA